MQINKVLATLLFLCLSAFVSSQDPFDFHDLQFATEEEGLIEECWLEEEATAEEEAVLFGTEETEDDSARLLFSLRFLEEVIGYENGEEEIETEVWPKEEECWFEEGATEEGDLWDEAGLLI